jgi:predicted NAD/FAD-dependent oxidoreductase
MLVPIMAIHDVIVLGAGVAGLQCARRLRGAGVDVLVVDRSDKPGGRCATRTFDGQPADYGPLFMHGDDPGFLAAVGAVPGERLEGWPARVSGRGAPCQPDAFAPFATRLAFTDGMNAFPRSLAEGLSLCLRAQAVSGGIEKDAVVLTLTGGDRLHARDLVLAMALEQTIPFVRMLGKSDGGRSSLGVLEMFASIPCLTVIAGYDAGIVLPDWDICYPEDEPALLLMSNESSKRPRASSRVLLFQASANWSMKRLERPKEEWGRELLEIAAHRLGPWAGAPLWTHLHRWRYSRLDKSNELTGPLELKIGVSRIGIAGELFSPGGGLQAAWLSGDRLGKKLAE